MRRFRLICADVFEGLSQLPDESVHCVVTSPPYWGLRDYGTDGQIGLEATPEEYVERMVAVFREVHRVLRSDGTLWLNMGDSYVASSRGAGGGGLEWPLQRSNRGSCFRRSSRYTRCALPAKNLIGRGGPRNSDRLLRWDPDQEEGVWNATEETELSC